jgi:hypothetical protein
VIRTNADAMTSRRRVREGKRDRAAWSARADAFVGRHGRPGVVAANGGGRQVEIVPAGKPAFFIDAADPTHTMA